MSSLLVFGGYTVYPALRKILYARSSVSSSFGFAGSFRESSAPLVFSLSELIVIHFVSVDSFFVC